MKKLISTATFCLITVWSFTQTKSLSDQLWERVQVCNSMFEDFDEDGNTDYDELIDDSKNSGRPFFVLYSWCHKPIMHLLISLR